MTNAQYTAMLLVQRDDEIPGLAEAGGADQIRRKAEKQIAKIDEKLRS